VEELRRRFTPLMAEDIDPEFYNDPDVRRLLREDAEAALRDRAAGRLVSLEELQAELKAKGVLKSRGKRARHR